MLQYINMKNKFLIFIAATACIFFAFSCHQKETELARFIPKDASMVFIVDAKSVTDKINASGITIDSLANLFNKDDKGMHWSDLKNSGIDLDKSFFVFAKETSSMQTGKTGSFGLVAEVKDKNAVENFFKKQSNNTDVKSENKYHYLSLSKGIIAGWNDAVVIISGVSNGAKNNIDDTLSRKQLTALFAQEKSNSVASIDEFNNMLKKTGDMHFWINPSGSLNALPMLGMTKINELFEGTYTEGVIDFEKGKAIASAESHINKTLGDIIKKYPSREIKKEMITNFPGALNAFGVVSFNPKVLLDVLHFLGFDMMANNYITQLGFSLNDVMNAFSGDIAFMFARSAGNSTGSITTHSSDFLVSLQIGDKAAFDKVINGLMNKNLLSKNGDQYQLGIAGGHGFIIETTNNTLVIASGDALIKSYIAGNNKTAIPADVEKEINNKSMAIYVDINSILNKTSITDTSGRKISDLAQQTFKNIIATTDKGDAKSITSNFELNFINPNENSLSSLVKFMAVAHDEEIKHKSWTVYPPLSRLPADSMHSEKDTDDD